MNLTFYARRYDVANATFIDDTPKVYSIAVCTFNSGEHTYESWSSSADHLYNDISYSTILYPENNIFIAIRNTTFSGELRFCLTDNVNKNYFYYNASESECGFQYESGYRFNMFTTRAVLLQDSLAVLSRDDITIEPRVFVSTGTFYYEPNYQEYRLRSGWGLFSLGGHFYEQFCYLMALNPGPGPGPTPIPDPYEDGGNTDSGGGTGDFDNTSDPISIPNLPSITVSNTGFITLFNPSISDLQNLAAYMWSNLFDLNGWKKIFADPMDAILGLSIVPVNIVTSGTAAVTVGNISTGITMPLVLSQYATIDCGSVTVSEYWGAYLDYAPYTKAEIYLPYCGIHAIDIDDIMGKSVNVVYHVDILSGACCVYIKSGNSILYTFIGQCSSSIPITGDNWTNVINGVLSAAVSVGSMAATNGITAGKELPNLASNAINNTKPTISKSGAMGGTGGMLAYQKPYLIITRPRQALPKDQNKFIGYPSFITVELGELTGYTEVESVHLVGVNATENELKEIEQILMNGVIF